MRKLNLRIRHEWSLVLALLAVPLIIAMQLPILLTLAGLGFATIFFIGVNWPKAGLLLFIFLRPTFDFLYQYRLTTSSSFNFTSLYALLTIAFCLLIIWENRQRLPKIKSWWAWMIMLLIGAASLYYTISLSLTIDEFFRLTSIVLLFTSAYLLFADTKGLTNLIRTIIFSSVIPAAIAFWQLANDTGMMDAGQNRVFGTFAHPNMLAYFLVLPITLATFAALNLGKNRVESYGYAISSAVLVVVLAFTYTRGAYVALAIMLLIIGLVRFRAFLLVATAFGLIIYLALPQINARVNSLLAFDPYGSMGWRVSLWTDGFSYFQQKPLLGNGLGTGPMVIADNRDFSLGATEPHNDYLRIGLENGVVGVVAYLGIIFTALLDLYYGFKNQKKPRLKMLTLFAIACFISLAIMSFGDNILSDTALQWPLWALLGSIIANNFQAKKDLELI